MCLLGWLLPAKFEPGVTVILEVLRVFSRW